MFLFLLACTAEKSQDSAIEESIFTPDMPQSECGLDNYDWLSIETMGDIVSAAHRDELSLDVGTIQALLSNYELPLPAPEFGVDSYYIQYTSQDKGQEALGTGMIVFPRELENAPVILWVHPTMGFADECAPTAQSLIGAAYPVLLASLGFIVVAPDYLGMSGWVGESTELHPYVIAEPTAIFSIDSLRALPKLISKYGLDISFDPAQIAIWGASEGGFAALFTDRYLPHYGPEFQSFATIAAIPATDPLALAQHGVQTFGPTTAGIIGVEVTARQWYQQENPLSEMLQPEIADGIEEALYASCDDFPLLDNIEQVSDIFTQDYIDAVVNDDGTMDSWICPLKENRLVTSNIPLERVSPTYITTAELDDLAIAAPVHADIVSLCEQGYEIVHQQCEGAGHVDGALDSLGDQWDWLQARLQGETLGDICQVKDPAPCGQ